MDSQVCSGCVMGHVVIVSLPLDGPRAMAELRILEAKHVRADLDHRLLGFYPLLVPFPPGC